MMPSLEISQSLSSNITLAQLKKGYEKYCCPLLMSLSKEPVSLKNHPDVQQRNIVYDKESIQKALDANGGACPYTRIPLKDELAAFESMHLEQLIFSLEVEKQREVLSHWSSHIQDEKTKEELNGMLKEIKEYVADLGKSHTDFVKKAKECLENLLKNNECSEISLDAAARLASFGINLDYSSQKAYAEKRHIAETKAKQEREIKLKQEQELKQKLELEAKQQKERKEEINEPKEDNNDDNDLHGSGHGHGHGPHFGFNSRITPGFKRFLDKIDELEAKYRADFEDDEVINMDDEMEGDDLEGDEEDSDISEAEEVNENLEEKIERPNKRIRLG